MYLKLLNSFWTETNLHHFMILDRASPLPVLKNNPFILLHSTYLEKAWECAKHYAALSEHDLYPLSLIHI